MVVVGEALNLTNCVPDAVVIHVIHLWPRAFDMGIIKESLDGLIRADNSASSELNVCQIEFTYMAG